MPRLVYAASARAVIEEIVKSSAERSGYPRAWAFAQTLRDKCRKLSALLATMGRLRPDIGPNLRTFPLQEYVIVFRYEGNTFRVVSVSEGHRNLAEYIDDEA